MANAIPYLSPGTDVSITFLPGEDFEMRVRMAQQIRQAGLTPIPHLSARRIATAAQLDNFLGLLADRAAVDAVFVIAGDPKESLGVFEDAHALISSAQRSRYGIRRVGIAGYPEGHPDISNVTLWNSLKTKEKNLTDDGFATEIVTQFSFDSDAILRWLTRLREERITSPVKIGIPGPASVASYFG